MLRRWLRSRPRAQPHPAVLQSSAVGLIHFPTLTMPPPTASRVRRSEFRAFGLEPSAASTEAPATTQGILDELEVVDFSRRRVIVVGVTHDQAARNALRWAYQRAVADDATLVVVTAFEPPCPALTIYGWASIDARDAAVAAKFVQDNVVRDELQSQNRGTRIRTVIARGDPAKVLVEAARNADLLVVGRRTSRLRSIASRSISRRCASRADCPVVVVRGAVSVGNQSSPTRRRPVAPAGNARSGSSADGAARHLEHARAHPQFEFRRHAR
ncbi:MAG: universal stress protein [Acidimicrobiia bacterium]